MMTSPQAVDIAIIGGGISGLYCAYKLTKQYPDSSIAIFEQMSNLGGRIATTTMHGFTIEYGPMRFESIQQKKLSKLMWELGLKFEAFPYMSFPPVPPDFAKLFPGEAAAIHMDRSPARDCAILLLVHTLKQIIGDQWDLMDDDVFSDGREGRRDNLRRFGKFQGKSLWKWGIYDILQCVMSHEALEYLLKRGAFFQFISENPNAADYICLLLDLIATSKSGFVTIQTGSYSLVESIKARIPKVKIFHDQRLSDISEPYYGQYLLQFNSDMRYVTASRVVFALNHNCLLDIDGIPPQVRAIASDSIQTIRLYKVFAIVQNPPWQYMNMPEINNKFTKQAECMEIYFFKRANMGLMLIYGSTKTYDAWCAKFCTKESQATAEENNNPKLKDHLTHTIHKIFPRHRTPFEITSYAIRDWTRSPVKCGMSYWKPNVNSTETINELVQFRLRRGGANRVHICGESFSEYQCFVEGCLGSVDRVIDKIRRSSGGIQNLQR